MADNTSVPMRVAMHMSTYTINTVIKINLRAA